MLPITFGTQQTEKRHDTFQMRFLVRPKSDKIDMTKEGATLIILVEGYSILLYLLGFIFTVL